MSARGLQILSLTIIFGLQYLFEHFQPQKKELNDWKNERFNLLTGLINVFVVLIPGILLAKWLWFIRETHAGLFNSVPFPKAVKLSFTIIILDIWMYLWHKLNHRIPFLWKYHSFHHKDQKMNTTTAVRFHMIELLLSYPGKAIICYIAGVNYNGLILYETIFFFSIVFHHSNIRINKNIDKAYRRLFVSPIMHRIHHSIVPELRDHNFGAVFSVWDLLFKTYQRADMNDIEFGVSDQLSR